MEVLHRYFPNLSAEQSLRFAQLDALYREWNQRINVISRKDIDNLYLHHVLHSLAITQVVRFQAGASILDLGTGGGFPGIPLAIFFPETQFHLIDSTGKKIVVVEAVAQELGLQNVSYQKIRAEEVRQSFDFVVSRAVAGLNQLFSWSLPLIDQHQRHALPNGLITLKGGKLEEERKAMPKRTYLEVYPISDFFQEDYFEEKFVVYVQA